MNFIKVIVLVLILIAATYLATNNWYNVPINLSPGHDARIGVQGDVNINLPLLLLLVYLVGFLPYFILHRMTRWSLRRKLSQAKRELETVKHDAHAASPAIETESK